MLFRFGKIDSPLCSFCKMVDETPIHLLYNCTKTKLLWDQLKYFISNITLSISSVTPQSVILVHIDLSDDNLLINHHLILIYKFYISNSRNSGYLNIEHFIIIIIIIIICSGSIIYAMVLLPTNLKNINKRIKAVKIIYKIYMINIRVP